MSAPAIAPALRALEPLRERHLGFLRRRVGSDADAEDLLQQSLLRAAERAHTLEDPARVAPWFWRILRRAVADHRARKATDRARLAALAADAEAATDEENAACGCALGLLSSLHDCYAEILRRVDLEDARVADAAAALGITPDNAMVRLHRARKALRAQLQVHCGVTSTRACYDCDCADEGHRCCGDPAYGE